MIDLEQAVRDDRISPLFATEIAAERAELLVRVERVEADREEFRKLAKLYGDRQLAAEAEVARLNLPENRGIGDVEITGALKERDALRAEVKRVRKSLASLGDDLIEWYRSGRAEDALSNIIRGLGHRPEPSPAEGSDADKPHEGEP